MYIREVHIENIRSISQFDMKFRDGEEAGWHVLIGDNGSGKTTILRCVSSALVGDDEIYALRQNWGDWLNENSTKGSIKIGIIRDVLLDMDRSGLIPDTFDVPYVIDKNHFKTDEQNSEQPIWTVTFFWSKGETPGWFSTGFGPFRRFSGGANQWDEVFKNPSFSRLASHLSLFGEDVALTEISGWLQKLYIQHLEGRPEGLALGNIKSLINSKDFLPHTTQLTEISSEGIFFANANGERIGVNQLSDGYRSVLSLTFELVRQLIVSYGSDKVFENIRKGEMNIPLPGVVLIDEIDAHLHPTWQTRIGQWFTKYFPNLQFIVTTHSPLVCRACEKGTIWRLAAPGSNQESGEITGTDRDKLIYGNILDAYGTELFGKAPASFDVKALEKKEELVLLSKKKMAGALNEEEAVELNHLQKIFATDDIVEL